MTAKESWFPKFARFTATASGKPVTFALAVGSIVLWAVVGPLFGYSDTWQLVINTATTIVTFLMVFLIQNTQNRDTQALQLKLDELIRATRGAHNLMLGLDKMDDAQLKRLQALYEKLADQDTQEEPRDLGVEQKAGKITNRPED
jgi:low affinity Fe/Cu permease